MRGVEHDTVIHISIQFWKEPWPFGMENEKTEIRSIIYQTGEDHA